MSLPIIFVHQNFSYYMQSTIQQVLFSNPESEIILLGDRTNDRYRGIRHFLVRDIQAEAQKFRDVYQHMSSNSVTYERFCFERWFVLLDFMKRQGLESCFTSDSDVMLYSNVTSEQKNWMEYDFTSIGLITAGISYINSRKALEEFCEYMVQMYTDPALLRRLKEKYENHLHNHSPGGVCDMTAVTYYAQSHPGLIGDIGAIKNSAMFDQGINISQGLEMQNGTKRIYWKNGLPYGKLIQNGEMIRFHALHFQGNRTKRTIWRYYSGPKGKKAALAVRHYLEMAEQLVQRRAGKLLQRFK